MSLSRVQLSGTSWTLARQAPLSMGFFRPEYWSGLPFPSPGDLPNPGIEPESPALQVDSLSSESPAVKNLPAMQKTQEMHVVPGSGRFPGGGYGKPLQCSGPEKPMDREAPAYNPWGCKELDTTEAIEHIQTR